MLKTLSFMMVALLAAGSACKKEQKQEPAGEPKVAASDPAAGGATEPTAGAADAAAAAGDKATEEEAEKKRKQAEELAQALKEAEEEAAKEATRWNDDLKKKVTALVEKKHKDAKSALKAILASPHRVPGNSDRDKYRHPVETLTFFGIKPNMTVVEMGIGEGWYTELLAPLLAREGKFVAASYDPNGPPDSGRTVYGKRARMMLDKSPELFGKVQVQIVDPPE
jgi:hypothetical protein